MKRKLSKTLTIITVLIAICYMLQYCFSENYSLSYQLINQPHGSTYYKLNVEISQSLYEYYHEKNHRLYSNNDFAKFVTPYALKPIADNLWKIHTKEEDFTNGVLMIVHQIPHAETVPSKYPVETIAENMGDCDLFSYIAASILNAAGLDVVLLYYESEAHMNVGVHLPNAPKNARGNAYFVKYNDAPYYVAECIGGDWENGWRVGECPDNLRYTSSQVITLENSEQVAPRQLSASYKTLETTTISLNVSPTYLIQGSVVTLSGRLSPAMQNKTVTIYVKVNNSPWTILGTVATDSTGRFTCYWSGEAAGICYVRAYWSGDDYYAGVDSSTQTITVLSAFFVLLFAVIVILICVSAVVFLISRQAQQGNLEPQPPEVSL